LIAYSNIFLECLSTLGVCQQCYAFVIHDFMMNYLLLLYHVKPHDLFSLVWIMKVNCYHNTIVNDWHGMICCHTATHSLNSSILLFYCPHTVHFLYTSRTVVFVILAHIALHLCSPNNIYTYTLTSNKL